MHIVVMVVVGLIVGILARFFYPGAVHMSLIGSAILGIAGAFLAGFATRAMSPSARDQPFHPAGFIASIIGAMVLIFVGRLIHIIH